MPKKGDIKDSWSASTPSEPGQDFVRRENKGNTLITAESKRTKRVESPSGARGVSRE